MSGQTAARDQAGSYADQTTSAAWPSEVQSVMDAIAERLSWASLHWGTERVHPDAWPHVAAAALDGAASLIVERVRRDTAEEITNAIEAQRAEEERGKPGFAFGNWTFNEGIDRAAGVARSVAEGGDQT